MSLIGYKLLQQSLLINDIYYLFTITIFIMSDLEKRANFYEIIVNRESIGFFDDKKLHEYLTFQQQLAHWSMMQKYFNQKFTLEESNDYFDITHCIYARIECNVCRFNDAGELYDDIDVETYYKYTGEDGKNYLCYYWQDIETHQCLTLF